MLSHLTTSEGFHCSYNIRKAPNLGQDKISRLLFQLALPAILAQLINLLYNMVDRMYIGHIPDVGPNALTGVGVTPAADHVHFRLCCPGEHGGRAPCLHHDGQGRAPAGRAPFWATAPPCW